MEVVSWSLTAKHSRIPSIIRLNRKGDIRSGHQARGTSAAQRTHQGCKDALEHLKSYAKKKTLEESGNSDVQTHQKVGGFISKSPKHASPGRCLRISGTSLKDTLQRSFRETSSLQNNRVRDQDASMIQDLVTVLTYAHILSPKSILYDTLDTYYEKPEVNSTRTLRRDLIFLPQSLSTSLIRHSKTLIRTEHDDSLLRYHQLFFFETKLEDDMRRCGSGKGIAPIRSFRMGLFMDGDGILCISVDPGSDNENKHVIAMEKTINQGFQVSEFIYVADAGCNSSDIRLSITLMAQLHNNWSMERHQNSISQVIFRR